jgi:hypothetical protein
VAVGGGPAQLVQAGATDYAVSPDGRAVAYVISGLHLGVAERRAHLRHPAGIQQRHRPGQPGRVAGGPAHDPALPRHSRLAARDDPAGQAIWVGEPARPKASWTIWRWSGGAPVATTAPPPPGAQAYDGVGPVAW